MFGQSQYPSQERGKDNDSRRKSPILPHIYTGLLRQNQITLKILYIGRKWEPYKRYKDSGESELVYDQERVLAFDYCSIAKNYDLSLQLLTEKR